MISALAAYAVIALAATTALIWGTNERKKDEKDRNSSTRTGRHVLDVSV